MDNRVGMYDGHYLIETNAITKRVQYRTHRKRRINKKWRKRYGYKYVPDDKKILIIGGNIFATPRTVKKLIEYLKEKESDYAQKDLEQNQALDRS